MKKRIFAVLVGLLAVVLLPTLSSGADETFTIPAGSMLHTQLTTTLSTRTNQNGDPWAGKVVEPIIANGQEVVPTGSVVEGRVSMVKESGRVKGVAEMRLVAETITTPEGVQYSISAGLEDAQGTDGAKVTGEEGTIKAPSSKKADATSVGVSAGVGAGVGVITGGGKGSLYGAGVGALAGLIQNLRKRGKDIILPQGTELTFVMARTTTATKVVKAADLSPQ